MSETTRGILLGVFILATCVWVGGFVAIAVVARVATRTLSAQHRIAFFRGLGRVYALLGTTALIVAIGTGAGLASEHPWDGTLIAAAVLAAVVLAALGTGMVQARRMTRLRRAALTSPDDAQLALRVRRGSRSAAMLRATIGVLSLALIAVGTLLTL